LLEQKAIRPPDRPLLSPLLPFRMTGHAKTLVVLLLLSIFVALISSAFGKYAIHTTSGDWAQDMAAVETFYHNGALSPQQQPLDNPMGKYPEWSFRLVASMARLLDLNPLRSIQIWAIVWLILGCYVIAVRLSFLGNTPPPGTIVITAAYLAICAFLGFGIRGHIEGNFFFGQLGGTVLAVAGLTVIQCFIADATVTSLFTVLLGGIVLPNFHLVPAVWLTAAGMIVIILRTPDRKLALLCSFLVGIINVLSWAPQGGSRMAEISNNNGWFLTRLGQLSDRGPAVAVGQQGISSAEVFQDLGTHMRSKNVAPNLKNFRVTLLIVRHQRLGSLIVAFNIDSPITPHEVD
jgi:hypothetical protein